jgi:hypothetical protein
MTSVPMHAIVAVEVQPYDYWSISHVIWQQMNCGHGIASDGTPQAHGRLRCATAMRGMSIDLSQVIPCQWYPTLLPSAN